MNSLWLFSILTLAGSMGLDCATSWGQLEANRIVASGGYFRARGVAIKGGVVAGSVAVQIKTPRHRRLATVVNVAASGALVWAAQRNMRQR